METFTRLFGSLLLFVYHCFDRVVINGYLSGLSRPGQVAYFFHNVVGEPGVGSAGWTKIRRFWTVGRPTGTYPETGFEEIGGLRGSTTSCFLQADFGLTSVLEA